MRIDRVAFKYTDRYAIHANTHTVGAGTLKMGVDDKTKSLTITTMHDPFQENGNFRYTVHLDADDLLQLVETAAGYLDKPYNQTYDLAKSLMRSNALVANLEKLKMLLLGFVGYRATQDYIADEIENANE